MAGILALKEWQIKSWVIQKVIVSHTEQRDGTTFLFKEQPESSLLLCVDANANIMKCSAFIKAKEGGSGATHLVSSPLRWIASIVSGERLSNAAVADLVTNNILEWTSGRARHRENTTEEDPST